MPITGEQDAPLHDEGLSVFDLMELWRDVVKGEGVALNRLNLEWLLDRLSTQRVKT